MDIDAILNGDGYHIPNPAYKKGNGQPKFVITKDPKYAPSTSADMFFEAAKAGDLNRIGLVEDYKKYINYGITPREGDNFDDYQRNLAEYQSFLEKGRNSLVQTISEGVLGTAKAFADLFDLSTFALLNKDNDYQNPISTQLEAWQKQIKEATPIWQDPDKHLFSGGLLDSSYIFNGIPSIISSLTLLIPSKAVTFGLTRGASWITRNGLKFARNVERAHKGLRLGDAAEGASKVAKVNAYINGQSSKVAKNIIDYGIGGFTSRLLENYQEARQTYDESKPVWHEILANMSPEEHRKTVNSLKNEFGDDAADWTSNESIANLVAHKAANETFKDDMINIFSDVYQMYAIGKAGRYLNGPSRNALNRLNKQNIKTAGMSKDAVDKLLASRTSWTKAKDWVADRIIGGKAAIVSELGEGIEEAVNYIAQEEGFHYGKVLLNKEAKDGLFSDRLVDYMHAPQLWDAAFWGLAGGLVFNKLGEYSNRFTQAIDKIREAKKLQKEQINSKENPIKVPTFREAFKDTELMVRKANLESNAEQFREVIRTLDRIQDGEDIYHITTNNKLESQEEKDAAKEMAIREFRDKLTLDSMDAGTYDLTKDFLSSDELKEAFISGNHLTKQQADRIQSDVLSRGDELLEIYNKNLRRIYNAVADWGELNDADLTAMPAEIFNIIARENIRHELAEKYYIKRIERLQRESDVLEHDSADALEKARKENGIVDFKPIAEFIYKTQQLGVLNAEIANVKSRKQHATSTGQAVLRTLELNKKILEDDIAESARQLDDTKAAASILLSAQTAASIELLPFRENESHQYRVNENTAAYTKLLDAVANRDRTILSSLSPLMKSILDRNTADSFLEDVIHQAKLQDNIIKTVYDEKGNLKALKDINQQLDSNYREIAALKVNALFEHSRINTTKKQILNRADEILNINIQGRAEALECASHLYQQLAKKYGKDKLKEEIDRYIKTGEHTKVYDEFNADEQSAFESYTTLIKLNRPEQEVALEDIYNALNYNDIYEYSKKEDVVEIIRESRRRRQEEAAQKSSASQNSNSEAQNQSSNSNTQNNNQSNVGNGNEQIDDSLADETPLEEGEVGEGIVEIDAAPEDKNNIDFTTLTDDQLNQSVDFITNYLHNSNLTDDEKAKAESDLKALQDEKDRRQQVSSTGEQNDETPELELDRSDIVRITKAIINSLSEHNPDNITPDTLKDHIVNAIKLQVHNIDDDVLDELVDGSIAIVDRHLKKEGESVESVLAKNVIKLSRIGLRNSSDAATKEARLILNKTFDDLLDNFNRHLSKGKIDGKYIIPLEALIRYARSITNNEYEAQEMYEAFSKLIAENPTKYVTIQGKPITQNRIIENVSMTVKERKNKLDTSFGGRTFNIMGTLETLSEKDKDKVKTAIKNLKVGDKIYVKANYKNKKTKDVQVKGEKTKFVGGIDFIVVNADGTKVVIASAPSPMNTGTDTFGEQEENWYYTFPKGEQLGKKEYPIQTFFKSVFTSDNEYAEQFREVLQQYEALTLKDAVDEEIGGKLLEKAHSLLEEFAKAINVDITEFYQKKKISSGKDAPKFEILNSKSAKYNRIRHLAKLHVYADERLALDIEDLNYETEDNDEARNNSYKASIDNWFNKMVESSEARDYMTKRLEKLSEGVYDIGVEVESIGKQTLVITKEKDAMPVSQAIADQHKDNIRLAAGPSPYNPTADKSKVVISGEQPMSLGGESTVGRSVVIINTPDGNRTHINAYPIQLNSSIFDNNVKLSAFKQALSIRLDELMDEWYNTRNSEKLEAFIDMLGHKSRETRKSDGQLFRGFLRTTLPKGNGFSIMYKTVNGKILPPDSREDGEVHYLNFYDTVPLLHGTQSGTKARAAVQDFTRSRTKNPAVVWNSNPNPSNVTAVQSFISMKKLVKDVLINSLKVRIDQLNITADGDSGLNYGSFMTRDADGNFALRVTGIIHPSKRLKDNGYVQDNGDVVITGLGRDGNPGNFSDFILFNDLVNVTTRPIDGSNFSIFDNSDGDFGITYKINEKPKSSPVEKIVTTAPTISLSDTIKDIINSSKKINKSKAIVKALADRLAGTDSNLYNLINRSTIINKLLHKDVIFVEGFTGATYTVVDDKDKTVREIPIDAYAAYISEDVEVNVGDKTIKINKGQIVVSDRFMELLEGNAGEITDALHQLLHENVHAFIADNDEANKALNDKYKKELEDLWDEYTKKHPTSQWAKTKDYNDLEEFIVESLTDPELIKELNNTVADKPLNNPKKPKSLLGKLFDTIINWLSDILGKDFKVNKDNLFAKEYAIFEEAIVSTPKETKPKVARKSRKKKITAVEGTLNFEEFDDTKTNAADNATEKTSDTIIDNYQLPSFQFTQSQQTAKGKITIKNDVDEMPDKNSSSGMDFSIRGIYERETESFPFPTLRGGLDNLDGDTYFDIQEKINNGVISIKCN